MDDQSRKIRIGMVGGGFGAGLSPDAERVTRGGLGHPEGFLESLGNLYTDVAEALRPRESGSAPLDDVSYPTAWDGVMGIRFVESVVASHAAGGRWTDAGMAK
ncbi:MAG TPA: hypothetical protein VNL35_21110 [Chloroflexota bacterium]|nr:hypothetical protein [Chloroflexota bacterium]